MSAPASFAVAHQKSGQKRKTHGERKQQAQAKRQKQRASKAEERKDDGSSSDRIHIISDNSSDDEEEDDNDTPVAAQSSSQTRKQNQQHLSSTFLTHYFARKRVRIAESDDEEEKNEQAQLIDSIEDDEEEEKERRSASPAATPRLKLARSSSSIVPASSLIASESTSATKQSSTPSSSASSTPCNILGYLYALQSNTIPFASLHLQRLEKLRKQREKERMERKDEEMKDSSETIVSTHTPHSAAASSSIPSRPSYAISSISRHLLSSLVSASTRLLCSRFIPVHDWSLTGSFGDGVDIDANAMQQRLLHMNAQRQAEYVNQLVFDPSSSAGSLLAGSTNLGKINIYDFEEIWMDGRRIEREKKARWERERYEMDLWKEEKTRREEMKDDEYHDLMTAHHSYRLNRGPPPLRDAPKSASQSHHHFSPTFSIDLYSANAVAAASTSSSAAAANARSNLLLRQIDTIQWNPYNHDELGVSSQRTNYVYLLDLTRCDAQGSPHKKILCCDSSTLKGSSQGSTGVMDFKWFHPSNGGCHAMSQTLVACMRGGEVNVCDLRIPPRSGSNVATNITSVPKLHRSTRGLSRLSSSTPGISLNLSHDSSKVHIFTESGMIETWDTRSSRACWMRVTAVGEVEKEGERRRKEMEGKKKSSAAAASSSRAASSSQPDESDHPITRSLGLDNSTPSSRICSTSLHPSIDGLFSLQLLNGSVGMLDINPRNEAGYQSMDVVVPYESDFVSASGDYGLRTRRGHAWMPQTTVSGGGTRREAREKILAVANSEEEIEIWETSSTFSKQDPRLHQKSFEEAAVNKRCIDLSPDPLLERELARSFPSSAPPPNNLRLLRSFPLIKRQQGDDSSFSSQFPIMSLAVHPRVPYMLCGSKQQQIRVVTHESEIEMQHAEF